MERLRITPAPPPAPSAPSTPRRRRDDPPPFRPSLVIDIDLDEPLSDLAAPERYGSVLAIVRLRGAPVGTLELHARDGGVTAPTIADAIVAQLGRRILSRLARDVLVSGAPGRSFSVTDLLASVVAPAEPPRMSISVAVCTRDRPDELARCLDALARLDYPALEVIVVDNAPADDRTVWMVRTGYPAVRYVREPRPGLDWARNRAVIEARGEIVAFTDDDVVVDPGWARAIAARFADSPSVMAVTGLVVPYELESEPQLLFERYGGFGRGFERRWLRVDRTRAPAAAQHGNSGVYGTGANMAFRRGVFSRIGLFDPALDAGTASSGGGDLEMFFRVLKEGYTLVYEPAAVVRHCHRQDYDTLSRQLADWGSGMFAYVARSRHVYAAERAAFGRLRRRLYLGWFLRRIAASYVRQRVPRELIVGELRGALAAERRYAEARADAARIAQRHGPQIIYPSDFDGNVASAGKVRPRASRTVVVDVATDPIVPLLIPDAERVRVVVKCDRRTLGAACIVHGGQPVSAAQVADAIVAAVGEKLVTAGHPEMSLLTRRLLERGFGIPRPIETRRSCVA